MVMWSSRRLSHDFANAKGKGMDHREDSAKALPPRERAETRSDSVLSSRMLSQSLASTDRCEGRGAAKAQPELCLRQTSAVCWGNARYPPRAVECSYLFLAQAPLHVGRPRVAKLQHPDVQDQPKRCRRQ